MPYLLHVYCLGAGGGAAPDGVGGGMVNVEFATNVEVAEAPEGPVGGRNLSLSWGRCLGHTEEIFSFCTSSKRTLFASLVDLEVSET